MKNEMRNMLNKAACITGTVLLGVTDALIVTPIVKPITSLVKTVSNVRTVAKAQNVGEEWGDILYDYGIMFVDQEENEEETEEVES